MMQTPNAKPKLVMSWSSGKDSAIALQTLLDAAKYEVVGLMTSVSEQFQRISHHGVRVDLLEAQAAAIGLPLRKVMLPAGPGDPCTNNAYEQIMGEVMRDYQSSGVTYVGFGDLFLEDLRAYRERNLEQIGMHGVFPIWMRNTRELAHEIIDRGYKAILTCVEPVLGQSFCGANFDEALLNRLPAGVDPCGENGEFHTFVFDGPIFRHPVRLARGEVVCRDRRHYADLLPGTAACSAPVGAGDIPPV
jgi:uncharacterized protein (TIGR00290 family)